METAKTGGLIAAARKEKGLTQKELARRLHVSDRTVSKWERGAGFPDVALLEPLADVLDLTVLSLLHGEETASPAEDREVRFVIRTLRRRMGQKLRRNVVSVLGWGVLLAVFFALAFGILREAGAFSRPVYLELEAGVYVNGERVRDTGVVIDGARSVLGDRNFSGRFAIGCRELTCREQVTAAVRWNERDGGWQTIAFSGYGEQELTDIRRACYMSPDMTRFALRTEDGTVIATDGYLAALMALEGYYPLLW